MVFNEREKQKRDIQRNFHNGNSDYKTESEWMRVWTGSCSLFIKLNNFNYILFGLLLE